jgi:FSR family fosmidomycin resistance protein-like MFS transporter
VPVALCVEFVDELVDGTKGAALPLIRHDLHLSYAQLGLLIGIPLLVGGLLELPLGLVAGYGRRRHRLVLAGGLVFMASLLVVAAANSFAVLLLGVLAFYPASGAFVSLTQAALIDADPGHGQHRMAAWNLAGSSGAVCGPLLLAAVVAAGASWRTGYLLLGLVTGTALLAAAIAGPARAATTRTATPGDAGTEDGEGDRPDGTGSEGDGRRPAVRQALDALRKGDVARWLALLEISDLLLDVLTGFVGLYLVDVVHASPAQAAVGVAIRLAGGLAGDAIFVLISTRVRGRSVLAVSAAVACVLYPAFLLVPSLPAKLAILAGLSVATACWYPVIQAGLYDSLPGRSGIAVFLSSAAGMAGAVGPLAVGFVAERVSLSWALASLAIAPAVVLAVLPRGGRPRSRRVLR